LALDNLQMVLGAIVAGWPLRRGLEAAAELGFALGHGVPALFEGEAELSERRAPPCGGAEAPAQLPL
jgi:hypothetical protein